MIWAVLGTQEHVDSGRLFWNKTFFAFKNFTKFHVDFENGIKIGEIIFDF